MKNFLTLILVFISLHVFGTDTIPKPKAIPDFLRYSSPINSAAFLPISINNQTRSIDVYFINRGSIDSLKAGKLNIGDSIGLASRNWVLTQNYLQSSALSPYALSSSVYSKTASDGRYLQSYTETDPHRLLYFTVTGATTKTLIATLADSTKVTIAWADLQATGGSGGFTPSGLVTEYIAGDGSYINFTTAVNNNSNVSANTAARHTHSNKSLLDTYTQTEVNLADAVAKKHAHTNQSALDAVANTNTGDETGASIKTKLEALTATNRLDASAIKNIPPGSATLYSTIGTNTDGAMTQAATTAALGAKQDTATAKIYFDNNDFYKDGSSANPLKVKGKADSAATATALAGKQGTLTLTTTGTSGAATLTGSTLNIPNYATGAGGGGAGTPVGANMYRLASQSFAGGADTKVLFDNTEFDNDGTLADLTNKRFNITTTGVYIIAIQSRFNSVSAGEHIIRAIKNGSTELFRGVQYGYNSGIALHINASMVVKLTAGDYVEMFVNVPSTISSIDNINSVSPRMSIAQIK
jgi:hypothetical protein